MERTTISIKGMSCGHCVAGVTQALKGLDGVMKVEEVKIGEARVAYDRDRVSPEQIAGAVEELGYQAEPAGVA